MILLYQRKISIPFQVKVNSYKQNPNGTFSELFKRAINFDFCKSHKEFSKSTNVLIAKSLLWFLRSFFPEFVKGCPFPIQSLERVNKTFPAQVLAMVPNGIYRVQVFWIYKNRDVMLNVALLAEVY